MAKLIVRRGMPPIEHELRDSTVIGRASSSDLTITQPTVSRRHASVVRRAGVYVLSDLGSGNGTFVNRERISVPHVLEGGDLIGLGDVILEFYWPEHTEASHTDVPLTLHEAPEPERSVLDRLAVEDSIIGEGLADEAAARRLRLIYEVSTAVGQTFEEDQILDLIVGKLLDVFPQADSAVAVLYDEEHELLVPKASRLRGPDRGLDISRSLMRQVIETRSGILSADTRGDRKMQQFQTLHGLSLRTVLCVPMLSGSQVYGVLQLAGSDPRRSFVRDDMILLLGIAGQTALALANARLHERLVQQELIEKDLELATKIQQGFLPNETPSLPGFEFDFRYSPALQVGGDYFGFLQIADGLVGVAVGDVSGKGVSAALFMARLSSEIRYQSVGRTDPGEILARLNDRLADQARDGMFVTLVLCCIDTRNGTVTVANAGHHPPLVRRRFGLVEGLEAPPNCPLAVLGGMDFETRTHRLEPGEVVMLFTDGVSEAENAAGAQFGEPKLAAAMGRVEDGRPAAVVDGIERAVLEHLAGQPQNDDITLVGFGRVDGGV
ncbi:MAG TPA: SpoIIE family protein phosphatase [Thermoanaerobaculia bacterium]|nr:SpoIIE family protein phosphatase [Thermoanaerobaculia bacterium]